MKNSKSYYGNCVSFLLPVRYLSAMIDSGVEITRRTFLRHVNREDLKMLEADLCYEKGGLQMASDWAVGYYKGKLRGQEVVWFSHSAIEYVFK